VRVHVGRCERPLAPLRARHAGLRELPGMGRARRIHHLRRHRRPLGAVTPDRSHGPAPNNGLATVARNIWTRTEPRPSLAAYRPGSTQASAPGARATNGPGHGAARGG